jgi:hypothetical protein
VSYIRVMFLGGKLDHTTREVPESDHTPGMPQKDTYLVPPARRPAKTVVDHLDPKPDDVEQVYYRHKVDLPPRGEWWLYVLRDHSPSLRDLIDTCPFLYI